MRSTPASFSQIRLPPDQIRIYPHISWLVIIPVSLWAIAAVYVPILGGFITPTQTAWATFLIALLVAISILCHYLGHWVMAHLVQANIPERMPIFLFGEAAQVWPASPSLREEALIAMTGPLFILVAASLAYLTWILQHNIYLDLCMPIMAIFNAWLAIINLAPVFPFDGGRLMSAIVFKFSKNEPSDFHIIIRLGYLAALAETGWGIFLLTENTRYSLETGIITIIMALFAVLGLVQHPAMKPERQKRVGYTVLDQFLGVFCTGFVLLILAVIASSLLMTNYGVEAPGVALSVEPMVEVPAQYRHQTTGTFLLTSVLQQSPIPAGIWMLGQFIPVLKILPPEKITPNQPSVQESARQGFQMLDQSEKTAAVVGLRLAGYNAEEVGKGAGVTSVLPESPSQGILMPGDIITLFNGEPVHTAQDLIKLVQSQVLLSKVHLLILRDQQKKDLTISLMSPSDLGGPPRIGITIQDAGFDYSLPIPVKIVPQKIVGGPSAGLMFTLTLYNMLTSNDLTGGRRIAGTGTINPDGSVGPIGGVQQKVAAAEEAGAV